MERLRSTKSSGGIGRVGLRTWGLLFLLAGIVSRSTLQHYLLGVDTLTPMELVEAMQRSEDVMRYATGALVMQAIEICAVPIFALLLTEGMAHTRDFNAYWLRVTGVAVLSEIPYNLAMSGSLLDLSSRNPAFGPVLALAVMYFWRRYSNKTAKDIAARCVVTLAAVLWCAMLNIGHGAALVILTVVLWLLRSRPMLRSVGGASVALVFSTFSMYYMASPMGFLAVHFYNGEKGEDNRLVSYLAYPVMLLALALAGKYLL